MDKTPDWIEKLKELPNWIKGAIGFLTVVITFFSLVLDDLYRGIFITVTVSIVAIFILCLYFAFNKKVSKNDKQAHARYRRPALVGIVLVPLVAIILVVYPPTHKFSEVAIKGTATPTTTSTPTDTPTATSTITPTATPSPTNTPTATPEISDFSITGMLIAEAADHYRVEVSTYNPLDHDVFVNHVKLKRSYIYKSSKFTAQCGSKKSKNDHYVLSGQIIVGIIDQENLTFSVPISPKGGELSGYQYVATGSAKIPSCGRGSPNPVEFGFDASLVLTAKSHTTFWIDVPKEFATITGRFFKGEEVTVNAALTPSLLENYDSFNVIIELDTEIGSIGYTKHFFAED